MTHSLTNLKTQQALRVKLVSALTSAEFIWDSLITWDGKFDAFCSEAAKAVSKWVTQSDILGIVSNVTSGVLRENNYSLVNFGKMSDYANGTLVQDIAEKVVYELCELPKKYEIDFPIPNIEIQHPIEFFDGAAIFHSEVLSGAGLGLALTKPYLRVKANGYASFSRQGSAFREATSTIKVVFYVGTLQRLFEKRLFSMATVRARGISGTRTETVHRAQANSDSGSSSIELTLAMSQYLTEVGFPQNKTNFNETLDTVRSMLAILYHPDAQENVQSIRRAIEWGFDAEIDEDETTRFIKNCIGLEALLTDQVEGIGITEQLADRCAYLMSKTSNERENIRKKIREIYKLRSKIVHGAVAGLSPHDALIARDASIYLAILIRLEMKGVTDWWTKRVSN